jgi:DUF1365 family protein
MTTQAPARARQPAPAGEATASAPVRQRSRTRRLLQAPLPAGVSSALYVGHVMHQRLRPARHRLRYGVFSMLFDLDELPALHRRLRLFSLGRFNLFSLRLSDFGAGDAAGPRAHVEQHLQAAGLPTGGPIRLLAMPRILGYAFNPLTVYFCHAADGRLGAILYEVNNTFGERHSYLAGVGPRAHEREVIEQRCDKCFHVSPFLGLDMHYRFRVLPPDLADERLSVGVTAHDAEGPVLVARLDAQARELTDRALLRAFFTHPLLTLKVVAGIHWEALRLLFKRVPVHDHPQRPAHSVTLGTACTSSPTHRGQTPT